MPDQPLAPSAARLFAERTAAALGSPTLDEALALVVELAIEVGVCDEGSVTQRIGKGEFDTAAPSSEVVVRADELQYALDEGPCVQAVFDDALLSCSDIRTDVRWPRWGPAAADLGLAGIISAHLYDDADHTGSLNLYSRSPRDYTDADRDVVRSIAAHAFIALAHFRGEEHLWNAIDSRHHIGMAQGILMQRYDLTADKAFELLRDLSEGDDSNMRDVAVHIAYTRTLPPTPVPPNEGAVGDPTT